MSGSGVIFSHFFLIFFTMITSLNQGRLVHGLEETNGSMMMPLMEGAGRSRMGSWVELNESRRRLGSFQICALCTCCGGPNGDCLPSPCCYAINCNIPNRPFGFCAFTPKICNCFGCHL